MLDFKTFAVPKNPLTAKKKKLIEEINIKAGEIIEITKDMIIGDVVLAYPETMAPLQKMGIHCVGCYASTFESIQEGALKHGLNPDKICKILNQAIQKTHKNIHL
jgi:hybrid cluster-associated redox disulfide protein